MSTGLIIRAFREKNKLIIRDISIHLGAFRAIISKIERGERIATREQIIKIAEILEN